MGAGETRAASPGEEFITPERAEKFYEKPDGADAGDAPRDSLGASHQRAWVRKMAKEYVADNPDLTPQQRGDFLSGKLDAFFWPMIRCLDYCKLDANFTKDMERRFEEADESGPEQRFMRCLDKVCTKVQVRLNDDLEKQYGKPFKFS